MNEQNLSPEELESWISKVSHEFYNLGYQDPWLKDVFKVIKQEIITSQQIDFMLGAMGGPKRYSGRSPGDAHPHIFINEEMWQQRESLLLLAFEKTGCPEFIRSKWLKIEHAFKRSMLMEGPHECRKRWATDELVIVPKPKLKIA